MKLPEFDYVAPETLDEAIAILADDEDAQIISGGQSLLPVLAFRMGAPSVLVDLRRIPGLNRVEITDEGVHVGARVRWVDIRNDARLTGALPLFQDMIFYVAHAQIGNRGTVGGSLAHADPAAEMPCIALVHDCVIEVAGPRGPREVAAADFFVGPLQTALQQGEILTGVRFPAWKKGRRWAAVEFSRRKGDFALAGIAAYWDPGVGGSAHNVHLGAIGAGPTPLRLPSSEAALEGRVPSPDTIRAAAEAALADIDPLGDIHGDAAYRRALVQTLTERALARAAGLEQFA